MKKLMGLLVAGVALVSTWTGFAQGQQSTVASSRDMSQTPFHVYLGPSYNWANNTFTGVSQGGSYSKNARGQFWGLQLGLDYETKDQWYLGADVSGGWGRLRNGNLFGSGVNSRYNQWNGAVRGGYAFGVARNWLITPYLGVNYTYQQIKSRGTPVGASGVGYVRQNGWGVGPGVRCDYAINSNWNIGLRGQVFWMFGNKVRVANTPQLGVTNSTVFHSNAKHAWQWTAELPLTWAPGGWMEGWDLQFMVSYSEIYRRFSKKTPAYASVSGSYIKSKFRNWGGQVNIGYRF